MAIVSPLQAQRFEAEGTIEYTTQGRGHPPYSQLRRFRVARDGSCWKIRTSILRDGSPERSIILYNEAGCDGTNIFFLERQDRNSLPFEPSPDTALATGRVSRSDIPPAFERDLIYPIWLAYCSGPHLSPSAEFRLIAPLFPYPNHRSFEDPQGMTLPAKCTTTPDSFPKLIEWFSEGQYLDESPLGKMVLRRYPPPYDQGFLHARFQVSEFQPYEGLPIPSEFLIQVMAPRLLNNKNNLTTDLIYTIQAKLGSVRQLGEFSAKPELVGKTLIADLRCMAGDLPLAYASSSTYKTLEEIMEAF